MSHNSLFLLLILVNSLGFGLADQTVLGSSSDGQRGEEEGAYQFKWPIKQVAIIGAGISGLHAYNALLDTENFTKIRMFERDDSPGGNWHYSDEAPDSVPIVDHLEEDWWKGDYTANMPTTFPYTTTYTDVNDEFREKLESHRKSHRAPKPVWKSLNANAPSAEMKIPGFPWPAGQTWLIHHTQLTRYLRAFSSWLSINVGDKSPVIEYNTRVELVKKRKDHSGAHNGWTLVLKKFIKLDENTYEESWWEESFDAVVVASSHYQHPHYPIIPGLSTLQHRFPDSVIHSAQYRQPERFAGQSVIVVGDSSSGSGISLDINQHVNTSFISMRAIKDDKAKEEIREIELSKLPCNTTSIPDIRAIHLPGHGEDFSKTVFELRDRRNLTGINSLVLATGYRYAFPFLADYHNTSFENTVNRSLHRFVDEQPIVTNGRFARSLYLDTFYIDQPTIAFQGLNDYIQTLIYCKYTGSAIAKVWAGQAHLPTRDTMWSRFWDQVHARGGLNEQLQWLVNLGMYSRMYMFISWLNEEAVKTGGKLLDLPPDLWVPLAETRANDISRDSEKVWTGYILSGPEGKGRCVQRPVLQPEHELDEDDLYQLEIASEW